MLNKIYNYRIRCIGTLLVVLLTYGCKTANNCPEGYELSEAFSRSIDSEKYCELISKSLHGNSDAFKAILIPPVQNGLIIDHANVIAQLVLDIGKLKICEWISKGEVSAVTLFNILRSSNYNFVIYERDKYFKEGAFRCN